MEQRIRTLQAKPDHLLLVAEALHESTGIVGWIHAKRVESLTDADSVEIASLVIEEKARGQRIGEKLVAEVEKWAEDKAGQVSLRSQTKRVDAHRFYQRLGYRITKTSYTFVKARP